MLNMYGSINELRQALHKKSNKKNDNSRKTENIKRAKTGNFFRDTKEAFNEENREETMSKIGTFLIDDVMPPIFLMVSIAGSVALTIYRFKRALKKDKKDKKED